MMQKRNGSVSCESALKTVLASASELGSETIQLNESSGRILFKNIVADENIPQLDNSAMDGYAVRYNDTSGATVDTPVRLSVSGEIQAGGAFQNISVGERGGVRIMTGAPIPTGADAVIPVEYTKEDESGYISVFRELN